MRWWLVLLVAGCKAGVGNPDYGPPPDEATPPDLALPDYATPLDLTVGPDLCPMGAEICADGCDNDGNGYTDGEDPACAPIVIAGLGALGGAVRWTLTQPAVFHPFLMPPAWHGSAAYDNSVSPGEAWVNWDLQMRLEHFNLKTMVETPVMIAYSPRDVCMFGNTVIVVEQGANSSWKLHELDPKGVEMRQFALSATPAACASDGKTLYVAVHTGMGRSQFLSFDQQLKQGATVPMPALLMGVDRCIDFAWTAKAGFYGLFAVGGNALDFQLAAREAYPFAMDGGVGVPAMIPDGSMPVQSLGGFAP
jgi:hypothetical protein